MSCRNISFPPPHQSEILFLNWSNEDIFLTSLGDVFHNLAASYLKELGFFFTVLCCSRSGNISCIYIPKIIYIIFNNCKFFPQILITGSRVTKLPPTLCNFLFTYLYSIKFIYYFISFSFIYRVRFHISMTILW